MGFKCKLCGWSLPKTSFHQSESDIQTIIKHEKTCPKRIK